MDLICVRRLVPFSPDVQGPKTSQVIWSSCFSTGFPARIDSVYWLRAKANMHVVSTLFRLTLPSPENVSVDKWISVIRTIRLSLPACLFCSACPSVSFHFDLSWAHRRRFLPVDNTRSIFVVIRYKSETSKPEVDPFLSPVCIKVSGASPFPPQRKLNSVPQSEGYDYPISALLLIGGNGATTSTSGNFHRCIRPFARRFGTVCPQHEELWKVRPQRPSLHTRCTEKNEQRLGEDTLKRTTQESINQPSSGPTR